MRWVTGYCRGTRLLITSMISASWASSASHWNRSSTFAEMQAQAKLEGTSEMDEVELIDVNGQRHAFGLEVHFNGRVHLAMLSPKRRIRLGRRIVSASKPEFRLTVTRLAVEP